MMRWFRLYAETLHDPKVQTLDGDTFKVWINALCLACQEGGEFTAEALVWASRCDAESVTHLVTTGLLVKRHNGNLAPHNWSKRQYKSDTSTERMRRHRARRRDVTVTPPDTDTDTDTDTDNTVSFADDARAKGSPRERQDTPRCNGTSPRQKRKARAAYPERFERFYAAYPRKVGKAAAFEAWSKFDEEAQECMILASPEFAADMRNEARPPDKIPHAATWINQQRFTDYFEPEYPDAEETQRDGSVGTQSAGQDGSTDGGNLRECGEKLDQGNRRVRDAGPASGGGSQGMGGLAPVLCNNQASEPADDGAYRQTYLASRRQVRGSHAISVGSDRRDAFRPLAELLSEWRH